MAAENEQRTREFAEAFNERDVEGLVERSASDCVIVAQRSATEGPYTGHDGVRRWAQGYYKLVPDVRITLDRVRQLEDGRVLVLGRQSGTTALAATFDAPLALVVEFDGRLMRAITTYATRAKALEALGVVE